MKITFVIATLLFLIGCSGYRYSIIEDKNTYFLKGEFYNNNPFIYIKAVIPNSYLARKTPNDTAAREDIKSTNNYGTIIADGVIIDRKKEVEIKLVIHDHSTNQDLPARENGTYVLRNRQQVDDLNAFLVKNEKEILEKLKL